MLCWRGGAGSLEASEKQAGVCPASLVRSYHAQAILQLEWRSEIRGEDAKRLAKRDELAEWLAVAMQEQGVIVSDKYQINIKQSLLRLECSSRASGARICGGLEKNVSPCSSANREIG